MGHKGFVTRYLQEISLCIEMTGRTGDIYGEKGGIISMCEHVAASGNIFIPYSA